MMTFLENKLNTFSYHNVKALYELSYYSNIIYLIYTLGLTYILYPQLGNSIIYWYVILLLLTFARIYNLMIYHKYSKKYSNKEWYIRFIILSLSTALLFSSLGFYFIHQLNEYYQLLIILSLIGISSGASFSLAKDMHLNLTYMGTLLLPLLCTVFFTHTTIHYFLVFLISIYMIIYITIIVKLAQQSEKMSALQSKSILLGEIFKNTSLGIVTYRQDLQIIDSNEMASKLLTGDPNIKSLIGRSLKTLNTNIPIKIFSDAFNTYIESNYVGFNQDSSKDNAIWIDARTFSFVGKKFGIDDIGICIIEDKHTEYKVKSKLEFQATHDSLTNLLNRRGFNLLLNTLTLDNKHNTHYSMLLYLDINQFKSINDSLGHNSGDQLLIAIGKRLSEVIQPKESIGRLGGDEFLIVSPFISNEKDHAKKILQECSQKIQAIFKQPFIIQETSFDISASMGVVLINPKHRNMSESIRQADIAMYEAKYSQKTIVNYNILRDRKNIENFELKHQIKNAINNKNIEMYFQPILCVDSQTIIAAESLLRWVHPEKGILLPEEFLHIVVKSGYSSMLFWYTFEYVCQYIYECKEKELWSLDYISINLEAQELIEPHFIDSIQRGLKKYHLDPSDILIEITETSLIDNFNKARERILSLKNIGIMCALDDFGTGYSSLSYLSNLPLDTLKIDKEFIRHILSKNKEFQLLKSILDIAQQFKLKIIIEGIENKEQMHALLALNIPMRYQGYYLSKPLSKSTFTLQLLSHKGTKEVSQTI